MKRKFYITTSIAYTNALPHVGFALELIQADVLARYHRLLGEDVFFLTGTDEHGAKNVRAAEAAGKSPKEFTDKISAKFRELTKTLNISNDDFIRTTDRKRHWPSVKKAWLQLKKNNDIYKKKYRGLYCVGCEAFITRKDLRDGKCAQHQKKPEVVEEENYFFRLSKYSERVAKAIKDNKIQIVPLSRKNEILSFIKRGVEDISCSRPRKDLQWGIPVPEDNTQTVYIWLEALLNYISALEYDKSGVKFKKYWPADVQCIGKDIFRFHSLLWPALLTALGLPLPRVIFVHGFITVCGQKMSKSLGNVVDPFLLVKKYGTDPLRYYLLREIPPTEDGDFSYEKFEERYNADLAKGLGNLVARVVTLATKWKMQNVKCKMTSQSSKLINQTRRDYARAFEGFRFNEGLAGIWKLISWCDRYIDRERPWENAHQKSKIKNQKVLYDLLFALANIASMLQPFLPETSRKIFTQLGIQPSDKKWLFKPKKGKVLFPRLS